MDYATDDGAADDGQWRYALGSTVTTMLPYARYALTERVSTWAMAGTGSGSLTLDLDGGVSQHYDTDLSMMLAALGLRGELLSPEKPGGFAGTPHVGLGLSDTAREVRLGWRLSPAGGADFELSLDAIRREPADGNDAEHGAMLSGCMRW